MPRNEPRAQRRKFALDNVKVGPANPACKHAQKHLSCTRLRPCNLFDAKREARNLPGRAKQCRLHRKPSQVAMPYACHVASSLQSLFLERLKDRRVSDCILLWERQIVYIRSLFAAPV